MEKILDFGPYFYDTYEPVLQVVDSTDSNIKIASEALDYIKNVKPKPGKTTILVIAMGAGEYWGNNRNGDYFPEADLKKNYKNFETSFNDKGQINGGALIYKHHKNKLIKGHPWFGIVRKAFYNDDMHRVELLLEVDHKKAPDIVERIDNGDYPPVSMGVKIPYDICSICRKKSKKIALYCDHLKYEMRKIRPDGKKVYAINGNYDYNKHPKPLKFFDISFVFRPADQTGWMFKKVADFDSDEVVGSAHQAEKAHLLGKLAGELRKLSDIQKYVRGDIGAVKDDSGDLKVLDSFGKKGLKAAVSSMEPIDGKIDELSQYPMNQVLSTLSKSNILLTTPEFIQLLMKKLTGQKVPREILAVLAETQAEAFEQLSETPEKVVELAALPMFQETGSNPEVSSIIKDIKDSRDMSDKGILKKADTQLLRSSLDLGSILPQSGFGKAMTSSEYVDTPDGRTFVASRDAIDEAQFWKMLRNMGSAFGTSAALAAVYSYMKTSKGAGNTLSPIALIASAYYGLKGIGELGERQQIGTMRTRAGARIPATTPMIEKRSYFPGLGTVLAPIGATAVLNRYYKNKLESGTAGRYNTETGKFLDNVGSMAYHHPYLSAGSLMLGGGVATKGYRSAKKGVKKYLRDIGY